MAPKSPKARNRNLERKLLPGLAMLALAPILRLAMFPLRIKADTGSRPEPAEGSPRLVFCSYMIGDLFMALPALRRLAEESDVRVVCRPDCAEILRREGLDPVPFDNAFFTRGTLAALTRTWREAWRLRSLPVSDALDLDADPRTAFWLRVAGVPRITSYRRPFGALFDETFELPPGALHQADRDMEVVEEYLRGHREFVGSRESGVGREKTLEFSPVPHPPLPVPRSPSPSDEAAHTTGLATPDSRLPTSSIYSPYPLPPTPYPEEQPAKGQSWLLSTWTRKPEKNWPVEHWEAFIERLEKAGVPFAVLHAPDGDASHERFLGRLRGRAEVVEGSLEEVAGRVKVSAGVIATDNFLGHMAGYYGKPVLWINVSSPAEQVAPRGPRTVIVGEGSPEAPRLPDFGEVWRGFEALRAGRDVLPPASLP
jgi:ADP-heptose:LPS heptosyltransferase